MDIKFTGSNPDDMFGYIRIDSTILFQQGKDYKMDELTLSSYSDTIDNKIIKLNSDFLDINIQGKFLFI